MKTSIAIQCLCNIMLSECAEDTVTGYFSRSSCKLWMRVYINVYVTTVFCILLVSLAIKEW